MFCEKCGAKMPEGAKFCEKCGAPVETQSQSQGSKEDNLSYRKWIIGGFLGGLAIVAVVIAVLFATGILGTKKENVQTSNDMKSDIAASDTTEQPAGEATEVPSDTPVETAAPTPEPTEDPVAEEEANESDVQTADSASENDNGEDSEYIFPNSDSEYLTKADVKNLSASKLNLAKNELYARHGRKFDRADLQEHFENCSWYTPLYSAEEWDEYGDGYFFNKYEIKNRNLLKKWEDKKKK